MTICDHNTVDLLPEETLQLGNLGDGITNMNPSIPDQTLPSKDTICTQSACRQHGMT